MFYSTRNKSKTIRQSVTSSRRSLNIPKKLPTSMTDITKNIEEVNLNQISTESNDFSSSIQYEDLTSQEIYDDLHTHYSTHKNMLMDYEYISIFWEAICGNKHLFKDKIVLDIRCGVGLLSMFCAKAGAKHIYAIDKSKITQLTRRIICDNNFSNIITVIQGETVDVQLPVNEVDIIVSTFFGSSIYLESSLNELIAARDKWLKPNGLIIPDKCTLFISAIENKLYRRSDYWKCVYNFDMSAMTKVVNSEPIITKILPARVISDACPIKLLNLYTATANECKTFEAAFRLKINRNDTIDALITYFQIDFTKCHKPLKLSTAPGSLIKNWKPMVFFLNRSDKFVVDVNDNVYGVICMKCHGIGNAYLDIDIDLCYDGKMGFVKKINKFQLR